jgi:hypothetical protein
MTTVGKDQGRGVAVRDEAVKDAQARQLAAAITSGIIAQQDAALGVSGSFDLGVTYKDKPYGLSITAPSDTDNAWQIVIEIDATSYTLSIHPPAEEADYWMVELVKKGTENPLLYVAFADAANWKVSAGLPGQVSIGDITITELQLSFQRGEVAAYEVAA